MSPIFSWRHTGRANKGPRKARLRECPSPTLFRSQKETERIAAQLGIITTDASPRVAASGLIAYRQRQTPAATARRSVRALSVGRLYIRTKRAAHPRHAAFDFEDGIVATKTICRSKHLEDLGTPSVQRLMRVACSVAHKDSTLADASTERHRKVLRSRVTFK